MTVRNLIEELMHHPAETPVVAEWDSGWSEMDTFAMESDNNGVRVLVFDVEDYGSYSRKHEKREP